MKIVEIFTEQGNPVFYSTLTRAISAIPQPKAPGAQWASMIANLTNKGVKQSEIEWSGVLNWLQQSSGSITKDQLLQYIQSHEVQVHDIQHGVPRDHIRPDEQSGIEHGPVWDQLVNQIRELQSEYDNVRKNTGDRFERVPNPDARYKELEAINGRLEVLRRQQDDLHAQMINDTMTRQGLSGNPSKYEDYKLPGGKDYRELLLTTPLHQHELKLSEPTTRTLNYEGKYRVDGVVEYNFTIGNHDGYIQYWPTTYDWNGQPAKPAWIVNSSFLQNAHFDNIDDAKKAIMDSYNGSKNGYYMGRKDIYRSPHWKEPNILAHVRFDTRTDNNGNRVLHVAELQSDWHQQGRQKGYHKGLIQPDEIEIERVSPEIGVDAMVYKDFLKFRQQRGIPLDAPIIRHRLKGSDSGWGIFFDPQVTDQDILTYAQDDTDSHTQYGMRNKKGQEGVPKGPFQKEWPQLAMKRMLRHAAEKGYDRLTWDTGETSAKRYDLSRRIGVIEYGIQTKRLSAWSPGTNGNRVMQEEDVSPTSIADFIGKEAANAILNQPTKIIQNDVLGPTHVLSGIDLQVGGEGMKVFYDQILPTLMNKYGKKWGSKVFQTKIDASKNIMNEPSDPDQYVMPNKRPKPRYVPAWGIDITPEMRDSIIQGQPLWEQFINTLVKI